jgi:hypothetical protein
LIEKLNTCLKPNSISFLSFSLYLGKKTENFYLNLGVSSAYLGRPHTGSPIPGNSKPVGSMTGSAVFKNVNATQGV